MNNTEEAHKMTEVIYKNLSENFNPYIRQLLVCGKAYHKAMAGVSVAAHAFYDSIGSMGSCGMECKGGTEDIGEALTGIAKIQREIFRQIEESIKSLQTEVIIPLEQKLTEHFKHIGAEYKKYVHGHKTVMAPYMKAADSLRRFKKKNRSKTIPDEQRENHYIQEATKCHNKVERYRMDGLQSALSVERKYYCFVLDRLCAVTTLQANYHTQASQELARNLPHWLDLTIHPHILPPKAKNMLQRMSSSDSSEPLNGGPGYHRSSNGFIPDGGDMVPHHMQVYRPPSVHSDFNLRTPHPSVYDDQNYSRTLPRSSMAVPPPQGGPQVCAVYHHIREGESQLSFSEGDMISLIGEKADGWQYGYNTKSGKFGWFPLSFTEPVMRGDSSPTQFRSDLRVRSVGDLLDRGMPEQSGYRDALDLPGSPHRRKSLHDGSEVGLVNSTGHPIMSPRLPPPYPPPMPSRPMMSHTLNDFISYNDNNAHTTRDLSNHSNFAGYTEASKMTSALRTHTEGQPGIYSSNGNPIMDRPEGHGHTSRPSTPKRDVGRSMPSTPHREPHTGGSTSPVTERHGKEIRRSSSSLPSPPPPPPLPSSFPPPPYASSPTPQAPPTSSLSVIPKVPNFAPPPLPGHSSSLSLTVPSTFNIQGSTATHSNSYVSSPTPVSQNPQHSEQRNHLDSPVLTEYPRRSSNSHHSTQAMPTDYGTDDDGSVLGRNSNNAFSSVTLRRTATNDRSAPRF